MARRRRGGMRFRPAGGFGNKPDRSAQEARAEAVGEKPPDGALRARPASTGNRAGGKPGRRPPPGGRGGKAAAGAGTGRPAGREFRQPHLDTPAQVEEEKFEMVPWPEPPPKGLVENLKARVEQGRQEGAAVDQARSQDEQGNHHQRRIARNPRRRPGGGPPGGIHHRAHDGGTAGGQRFQGQGAQFAGRLESGLCGYRL